MLHLQAGSPAKSSSALWGSLERLYAAGAPEESVEVQEVSANLVGALSLACAQRDSNWISAFRSGVRIQPQHRVS